MEPGPLPNFLIIGAAKCGTTSLAAYLAAHPHVGMAKPKELNFFSLHWDKGVDFYRQCFEGVRGHIVGEASPSYTRYPLITGVPERIVSVIPDVRLIYLIRNPVERIRSDYRHRLYLGSERAPTLLEAIAQDPRYMALSRYANQIDQYLEWFSRDQLLIVEAERLKTARVGVVQQILRFLGADPEILPDNMDLEFNRADEKSRTPPVLDPLRSLWRRSSFISRHLPSSWRRQIRTRLGRSIPDDTVYLSPDDEMRIWEELTPDLRRLREILGAPSSLWGPDVDDTL